MFIVRSCRRCVNTDKPAGALLIAGPVGCFSGSWMMASSGLNNQEWPQTTFMYLHITTCVFGDAARDIAGWYLFMARRRSMQPYHPEPPHGWNVSSETRCKPTTRRATRTSRAEVALTRCCLLLLCCLPWRLGRNSARLFQLQQTLRVIEFTCCPFLELIFAFSSVYLTMLI